MQVDREHYGLLLAICTSLFFGPLMGAGVNAVLPDIGNSLEAGATALSMVGAMYSLGLAVFQLASGSLGDIWGHRRLFMAGIAIFGVCSACIGFLPNIESLLAVRVFQGVGSAMVSATGLVLLSSAAGSRRRPVYLGFSGAAVYAGIAAGPPLAGFLAGTVGWRWLFWCSALASLVIYMLMRLSVVQEWRPASSQKFDWKGCLLYGISVSALTFGAPFLSQAPIVGWGLLGAFVLFMAFFCWYEPAARFPILDLALLRANRVLSLSCIAALANFSSVFGVVFFFSFYLQVGKGMSVEEAGLVLAVQAIFQVISTPMASRMCQRIPAGKVSALGAALCGLGLLVALFLTLESPLLMIFISQAFLGVGISFFSLSNTTLIMDSAGEKNTGQAAGLIGAMRTGGHVSCMVLITLTVSHFIGNQFITPETMEGFMVSMRYDVALFVLLNVLAVAMALVRNRAVGEDGAEQK